MDKKGQRELLTILVLTVLCGVVAFFLAGMFDKTVSEVTSTRFEMDELTRAAVEPETRAQEIEAVENYTNTLGGSLPSVENIGDILSQLEILAQLTGTKLVIKLEEGVVGEGEIDFTDDKEREKFLKTLKVEEYQPTTEPETTTETDNTTNVALQMTESKEEENKIQINYLEISLNLTGTYQQIRTYLSLLENSKYIFNVKELRINRIEDGQLDSIIKIRAFIFEEK